MQRFQCALLGILFVPVSGCAVPNFDVPYSPNGPTFATIHKRIVCELVAMVKKEDGSTPFKHRASLLAGNYLVSTKISLKVTDTGELTPSFNFPQPVNNLAVNVGLKLGNTRSHTFSTKRNFSMKALHERWLDDRNAGYEYGACPTGVNHNLSGRLGIEKLVEQEFSAPDVDTKTSIDKGGSFGGIINFTLVRNVNSAGPTWTLRHFIGPGRLGKLERQNVNQLTIAFAVGPPVESSQLKSDDLKSAEDFITELLLEDID